MKKGANNTYWGNIREGFSSLLEGLRLSLRHFFDAKESRKPIGITDNDYFKQQTGQVTLQYPHESIPVPDNGRYRLHNEIDDCIVCDKCAKICPVDCIEIESVRAIGEIGKTSDGTTKRIHAARFDIDMGKCCFCGLCTTVCPTECLTMTKAYDFTEYDVDDHIYSFAEMTPLEILEKKRQLEEFQQAKAGAKTTTAETSAATKSQTESIARPEEGEKQARPRPQFKPKIKPKQTGSSTKEEGDPQAAAKRIMEEKKVSRENAGNEAQPAKSRPVFHPKIKPRMENKEKEQEENKTPTKKPVEKLRPVIKPLGIKEPDDKKEPKKEIDNPPQNKSKPRPVIKKRNKDDQE